jgi:hypothetical protein
MYFNANLLKLIEDQYGELWPLNRKKINETIAVLDFVCYSDS